MSKRPRTTSEHIISIYGHIEGLKKSIHKIETNHLAHMSDDIDNLDKKIDRIINWLIYGLGGLALALLGQVLYILTN